MDGWMDGWVSYFFAELLPHLFSQVLYVFSEQPLVWATSSLTLLWATFSYLSRSFCNPILLLVSCYNAFGNFQLQSRQAQSSTMVQNYFSPSCYNVSNNLQHSRLPGITSPIRTRTRICSPPPTKNKFFDCSQRSKPEVAGSVLASSEHALWSTQSFAKPCEPSLPLRTAWVIDRLHLRSACRQTSSPLCPACIRASVQVFHVAWHTCDKSCAASVQAKSSWGAEATGASVLPEPRQKRKRHQVWRLRVSSQTYDWLQHPQRMRWSSSRKAPLSIPSLVSAPWRPATGERATTAAAKDPRGYQSLLLRLLLCGKGKQKNW